MKEFSSKPTFKFITISDTKLPNAIKARFCFEEEMILIPNTEANLIISPLHWVFTDMDGTEIFTLSYEQFSEIYVGYNDTSWNYMDLVSDSVSNDIEMFYKYEQEDLLASDLSDEIEFANWFGMKGEVYLENNKPCLNLVHEADYKPMSFKDRAIVAWNILTNRNFKFDKVSMDWV